MGVLDGLPEFSEQINLNVQNILYLRQLRGFSNISVNPSPQFFLYLKPRHPLYISIINYYISINIRSFYSISPDKASRNYIAYNIPLKLLEYEKLVKFCNSQACKKVLVI